MRGKLSQSWNEEGIYSEGWTGAVSTGCLDKCVFSNFDEDDEKCRNPNCAKTTLNPVHLAGSLQISSLLQRTTLATLTVVALAFLTAGPNDFFLLA
jgi:hypothetical protein